MSKRNRNGERHPPSSTKRVPRKRARIRRKAKNPDVGYGKPPAEHQFKPGQSGNPKGRPKGRKSEEKMLEEILYRKATVRGAQGIRTITVYEAILNGIAQDSIKGNIRAAAFLFGRYAAATSTGQAVSELSADDKAFVDSYLEDFLAKNGETRTKAENDHE
jgi:hypothetical protein